MANEGNAAGRTGSSTTAILYPILGLLAIGNVVFLLLWVLAPLAGGLSGPRGGRRIQVRSSTRELTVAEGLAEQGVGMGIEARLASDKFEDLAKKLARLAQSQRGAEKAQEFFDSPTGKEAKPAVTLTFPRRTGAETLEIYAIHARRKLCYCRAGRDRTPVAIKADTYREIASVLARLGHGAAGSFPIPYYIDVGPSLQKALAKLKGQLQITTISSNPHQLLLDLTNSPTFATQLQLEQPDTSSLTATLTLPPYGAMARALAEAMARASDKVTARHLDLVESTEAVRDVAKSVRRSVVDIEDSLVLQYGERIRVIRSAELIARADANPMAAPAAPKFEGETVVVDALDNLLAERGLLYFAEGHGERRIADTSRSGLSRPAEQLKASGFRVAALDLSKTPAVPADCHTLVLAGPRKAYSPAVVAAIAKYVDAGGRLAVMLDPPHSPAVLPTLLACYGIAVAKPPQEVPAVQVELNRKLDFARTWTREPVVFLSAVALTVTPPAVQAPAKPPYQVHRVGRAFDRTTSARTPCVVAAAHPNQGAKGPKLLVFGDVDVFSNQSITGLRGALFGRPGQLIPLPSNVEMVVQAITWLAQ